MFEWLESVQDYFDQVGASIDATLTDLQILIDNLNVYIKFSTYYIYASGVVLVVLLVMGFAIMSKLNTIMINQQLIQEAIRSLKGGKEG